MKNLTFKAWAHAQCLKQSAKNGLKKFFSDEQGDVGPIIIGVVIIVIAVGLAIVFKDKIGEWLGTLFGAASEDINSATQHVNVS